MGFMVNMFNLEYEPVHVKHKELPNMASTQDHDSRNGLCMSLGTPWAWLW